MKNHVVKYPGSIGKALITMEEMKKYKAYSIISKAGLPEGTLFDEIGVMSDEGFGHTTFTILLPNGEAFSGFALKKGSDSDNPEAAACMAAGRAVAVWREQMAWRQAGLEAIVVGLLPHWKAEGTDAPTWKRIKVTYK